jgi:hypothetical protein
MGSARAPAEVAEGNGGGRWAGEPCSLRRPRRRPVPGTRSVILKNAAAPVSNDVSREGAGHRTRRRVRSPDDVATPLRGVGLGVGCSGNFHPGKCPARTARRAVATGRAATHLPAVHPQPARTCPQHPAPCPCHASAAPEGGDTCPSPDGVCPTPVGVCPSFAAVRPNDDDGVGVPWAHTVALRAYTGGLRAHGGGVFLWFGTARAGVGLLRPCPGVLRAGVGLRGVCSGSFRRGECAARTAHRAVATASGVLRAVAGLRFRYGFSCAISVFSR